MRDGIKAQITPFSSVVGQSVLLTDETGAALAHISIAIPDPNKPYRETAEEVARIIELAINQPPSEEVKRLRVRLGDLMVEDAKRMAAIARRSPAGGVREAVTFDAWFGSLDANVVKSLSRRAVACTAWHDSRRAALSSPASLRAEITHDNFKGDIIGKYTTREGKRGVVVQQDGTRVVHVYGEKWLPVETQIALSSPAPGHGEAVPVAWRDMDCAPKDGTHVLLAEEDGAVSEARWVDYDGQWWRLNNDSSDYWGEAVVPVAWQPMPLYAHPDTGEKEVQS